MEKRSMRHYTREELLKAHRSYVLPNDLQEKLAALHILASSGSHQPLGLAGDLEPLVNVNSSTAARDTIRRRPSSRKTHEDVPQVATEDAGEWHTVGERKNKKESSNATRTWRKPQLTEEHAPSFFEEGEGVEERSRLAKLRAQQQPAQPSTPALQWLYIDNSGKRQGPFSSEQMAAWQQGGYLQPDLPLAFFTDSQPTQFTPMKLLFPSSRPFVDAPLAPTKGVTAAPWSKKV
jgi:hypothetical protein